MNILYNQSVLRQENKSIHDNMQTLEINRKNESYIRSEVKKRTETIDID